MNIWPAISYAIDKLPLEKIFVRPPDRKKEMKELYDILKNDAKPQGKTTVTVEKPPTKHPSFLGTDQEEEPKLLESPKVHLHPSKNISSVSTADTVSYQNRELGKVLLQMERHSAQKFRINNVACDCGQSRHLLDLESLAEETMSMVDNPEIYNKILIFVQDVGPKVTIEALNSGEYDSEYAGFAQRARTLRKELIGTLDPHALFPHKKAVEHEQESDLPDLQQDAQDKKDMGVT